MALFCVSRYSSTLGSWKPGQEVDVTDEVAELLLRDSPGSFVRERPKEGAGGKAPGAGKPAANQKPADSKAAAAMPDLAGMSLDALKAFAAEQKIDLAGAESEEDVCAAIDLWREAQAKLVKQEAAGTTTNTRPQRQQTTRKR